MQKLNLEAISRHVKDKKVIRSCHHGFTNSTNLVDFYNEVTVFVYWRRAMDVFLYLSYAFDAIILMPLYPHGKLMKYSLGK